MDKVYLIRKEYLTNKFNEDDIDIDVVRFNYIKDLICFKNKDEAIQYINNYVNSFYNIRTLKEIYNIKDYYIESRYYIDLPVYNIEIATSSYSDCYFIFMEEINVN